MSVSHAPRHCEGRSQGINVTPEAGGVANPVVWSERPWEGTTDQPAKQEGTQDRGRKALASAPHPPGGEGRAAATARRILSYHRTGGGVWSCSDVGRVPWIISYSLIR